MKMKKQKKKILQLKKDFIKEAKLIRERRELMEQIKYPIITSDNQDCII